MPIIGVAIVQFDFSISDEINFALFRSNAILQNLKGC